MYCVPANWLSVLSVEDASRFEIRSKRIVSLAGRLVTIYVGGDSEIEKKNKMYLFEDAVLAVKSALAHGIIFGGNLIIPILVKNYYTRFSNILMENSEISSREEAGDLINLISDSFLYSFMRVLDNKFNSNPNSDIMNEQSKIIANNCISDDSIYNLLTRKFELLNSTSIINSAETDIQIMKSVFSIITLLVTSNQMLKMV